MRNLFRRKWYVMYVEGEDPVTNYVQTNNAIAAAFAEWCLGMGEWLKFCKTRGSHLPRRVVTFTIYQHDKPGLEWRERFRDIL